MYSDDAPQTGYLRSLECKRAAAFDESERQMIAAYREATQSHPQWARITPPIRRNEPMAGEYGYEGEIPPPPHITRRGWLVLGVGFFLAVVGWVWLVERAAEWIGGMR